MTLTERLFELSKNIPISESAICVDAADLIESQAAEIARINEEYQQVCRLVAQMHLAAVGGVVGPKLGVVEDVAAMKASHDKYKALCDQLGEALLHMCHTCTADDDYDNSCIRKALEAWRAIK